MRPTVRTHSIGQRIMPMWMISEWGVDSDQGGLACNFNALPRPGTVLVHQGQAEWIKRPETIEDIFRRDIVPQRLLDNRSRSR